MLEEVNPIIPLATPTRFLIENGEWNLTPSLSGSNEINPFDYQFQPQKETNFKHDYQLQPLSEPESDITPSPTTPPMPYQSPTISSDSSFRLISQPHMMGSSSSSDYYQLSQEEEERDCSRSQQKSSGRKRRIIFDGEDAEERRKKFLERNRVAAYKCRQKKKNWMKELEEKAEVHSKQNEQLRKTVSQLKEESMYLRNLLLAHGDCQCESVQAYLRKTSIEISNNTSLSKRNSSLYSTGLTPFLNTVINKSEPSDYFSSHHK